LGRANYVEIGEYYIAFFGLSTGLERLVSIGKGMKALDHLCGDRGGGARVLEVEPIFLGKLIDGSSPNKSWFGSMGTT
jgi:hypothetical protein